MKKEGVVVALRHNEKEKKDIEKLNHDFDFVTSIVSQSIYGCALDMFNDKKDSWLLNEHGITVLYFRRMNTLAVMNLLRVDSTSKAYATLRFHEVPNCNLAYLVIKDKETDQVIAKEFGDIILSNVFDLDCKNTTWDENGEQVEIEEPADKQQTETDAEQILKGIK